LQRKALRSAKGLLGANCRPHRVITFWFLVAPELDTRFRQWWMLPVMVAIAFWDNFLRR
jgi:hypothetical protein